MMIDFPEATRIHKRMPKEAFYKRLTLTPSLKEKFVSDADRIFIEHSLTMDNLRLTKESDVKEILLLSISLKKKGIDGKVIEAIARQNPHNLVFLLMYENERQLALYHGKLYRSPWVPETELTLSARGFSLEEIWNGFIEQIALYEEETKPPENMTIDERLALKDQINKLEERIAKTTAAAWKETQPKKRFDLYTKAQKYEQELEELKHGES